MDDDLLLAIRLQEQYDRETVEGTWQSGQNKGGDGTSGSSKEISIVDPSWELLDPNPDIHVLFLQFNQMFFWGKLAGVEVKWSPKMTLCAGVCSYEGRGGLCSIRLSKPLLILRSRKDLVETLLHEMIHALLFVTHNNKDRESHGPEFLKHMDRINNLSGAKISVYHAFHDEVEEYRKHWWRCNGPCQNRQPYFGYVKRAMNRAPCFRDPWWPDHKRTCGGTFIKIKEPETVRQHATLQGTSRGVFAGKGFKLSESSLSVVNKKVQNTLFTPEKDKGRHVNVFTGKGFKLGESSTSTSTSKTSISSILNFTTPLENKMVNTASVSKGAKIAVANTSVFMTVRGSPFNTKNQNVGSPAHKNNSPNSTQKRTLSEMLSSSQTTRSTSQERSAGEFQCAKKPRMEVTKKIKDFFQNGSASTVNISKIHIPDVKEEANETVTSSQDNVSCPVCLIKVPEANINCHLDNCLAL